MKEEVKLIFVASSEKQRQHIAKTCRRKQRRISPVERDHVWMGAVEKDVLLILYIICTSHK